MRGRDELLSAVDLVGFRLDPSTSSVECFLYLRLLESAVAPDRESIILEERKILHKGY